MSRGSGQHVVQSMMVTPDISQNLFTEGKKVGRLLSVCLSVVSRPLGKFRTFGKFRTLGKIKIDQFVKS